MLHCDLSQKEQHRRKEIAEHTRQMLLTELPIDSQDETSIMGRYRDYYLQISFSELHPLMVVCLAKALTQPGTAKQCRIANDLNLRSVLGVMRSTTKSAAIPTVPHTGWIPSWMPSDFTKSSTGASMKRTAAFISLRAEL